MILKTALCNLTDSLMESGYFNRLYAYAEIVDHGEKSYPQVYEGKGQYKSIYDFDVNGTGYIRKNGDAYSDHVSGVRVTGCSDTNPLIDLIIPLRFVAAVPKDKLGDDPFSDDRLAFDLMGYISRKQTAVTDVQHVLGRVSSYTTDRSRVWSGEVTGIEKTVDLTKTFIAMDFTLTFRASLECIKQTCEYGML